MDFLQLDWFRVIETLAVIAGVCYVAKNIRINKKERTYKFLFESRQEFTKVLHNIEILKRVYNYQSLLDYHLEEDAPKQTEAWKYAEVIYDHMDFLVVLYVGLNELYTIEMINIYQSRIKYFYDYIFSHLEHGRNKTNNKEVYIMIDKLVKAISKKNT